MSSRDSIHGIPKVSNWSSTSFGSGSYKEVWGSEDIYNPNIFHKAVFQLNSNKVFFRVKLVYEDLTEVIMVDVDLQEIEGNFRLGNSNDLKFSIREYAEPNLWVFEPPTSVFLGSGDRLVLEVKAKSGNKMVSRGMSEWGIVK